MTGTEVPVEGGSAYRRIYLIIIRVRARIFEAWKDTNFITIGRKGAAR